MPVIADHPPFGLGIMLVMQVIEAQSARSWSLTITFITSMTARVSRVGPRPWPHTDHPFGRRSGGLTGDRVVAQSGSVGACASAKSSADHAA
jgi:hypothetical protein